MTKEKIIVRPHFAYVFVLLYPYLTLTVLPVIKGVLDLLRGHENALSAFLMAEILFLILAVSISFFKFKQYKITFDDELSVQKGLFCRSIYSVPSCKARLVVLESNPIFRLLGIFRLKIYTETGNKNRPNESVIIKKSDYLRLKTKFFKGQSVVERSRAIENIIMAATLSSYAAGIIILLPFLKVTAAFFDKDFMDILPNVAAAGVLENLPFIWRILSAVLIAGYIVSFVILSLRNIGFKMLACNEKISFCAGVLPHRDIFLDKNAVTSVKLVAPPFMKVFKKCAIKFSACGYGESGGELCAFYPFISEGKAGVKIHKYFEFVFKPNGIKPIKWAVGRCFLLPSFFVGLGMFFCHIFSLILKNKQAFVGIGMIIILLAALNIAIRIVAMIEGFISIDNADISAKYRKGFRIETLSFKTELLECVTIMRTPFDRLVGLASVKVRISNKNRDCGKIENLSYKQVLKYIRNALDK